MAIADVECADVSENFEHALHNDMCKIYARIHADTNLLTTVAITSAKVPSSTDKKHDNVNCVMTIMSWDPSRPNHSASLDLMRQRIVRKTLIIWQSLIRYWLPLKKLRKFYLAKAPSTQRCHLFIVPENTILFFFLCGLGAFAREQDFNILSGPVSGHAESDSDYRIKPERLQIILLTQVLLCICPAHEFPLSNNRRTAAFVL